MPQATHEDLWSRDISFKSLQVGEEDQALCLCINQWLVEDSPGEEGDTFEWGDSSVSTISEGGGQLKAPCWKYSQRLG